MKKLIVVALFVVVACKSKDDMQEEIKKQQERAASMPKEPDPSEKKKLDTPEPEKKQDEIPEPDPSKPESVHEARKQAMILGRDKEVIRFCEMGKVDEKSDPQARLGCALAACRLKEADKAKMWAKGLEKALFEQANKVCVANTVTL